MKWTIAFWLSLFVVSVQAEEVPKIIPIPGQMKSLTQSLGFADFCKDEPLCQPVEATTVKLDRKMYYLFKRTWASVNSRIKYVPQPPRKEGEPLVWKRDATEGDCQEYVIGYWQALYEAGVPLGSMSVAIVERVIEPGSEAEKTGLKIRHAVLVVQTSRGEYVFDVRARSVVPWYQLKQYIWLFKTVPGKTLVWQLIGRRVT